MQKQTEIFNKEIETTKKNQLVILEMRNITTELKKI
jgi:hypothetical protein